MKNFKSYLLIIIFVASFLFPKCALSKEAEEQMPLSKQDIYKQLELFADAITIVDVNYVENIEPKDLIYGALKGMLRSLDMHSDFLTPEKYEEMKIDTGGEFGGLGIEITIQDNVLTIVTPLEDTPASKAGIMPNDKIIRIDGESTKDFGLDDAVKRLRGRPGEEVVLTIFREGEKKFKDITIKRAIIKLVSIKDALFINDTVAYVRITDFQQRTAQDLEKALRKLERNKFSGLILDLRNNPGGLLDSSIAVSEKFLPEETLIVSIKGRLESQQDIFKSKNKKPRLKFPMVVLVNKGSASASEIVAAAIKDNKRGIILGTQTFGKGSVQTIIPMKDGSAIRLTTSKYYTPNGKQIHNIGIVPDVIVERVIRATDADEDNKKDLFSRLKQDEQKIKIIRLKQDNQIESAIELLKGIEIYKSMKKQ